MNIATLLQSAIEPGQHPPSGMIESVGDSHRVDLDTWMMTAVEGVERALTARLPCPETEAAQLIEAMRYATLGGGKRIRPLLCHAAGAACGAPAEVLDVVGAAIEMIHVCTLVHDDLPAMDNDALRRGKPTVHVRYDEATAILVGDTLQAQAFLTLSESPLPAERRTALIRELAAAIGPHGVAGGQSIDLLHVGSPMSLSQLEQMHVMKTGALIRAALRMGALCTLPEERDNAAIYHMLNSYGYAVGLAFQVVDDILDATGNSLTLGKTAGKDAAANKPTYVSILGLESSRALVRRLQQHAHAALGPFGERVVYLRLLADRVVDRVA
jgi:farnesyl diphosphate synthase